MIDKNDVDDQELSEDEALDRIYVQPDEVLHDVQWRDSWSDPSERPGDRAWIEEPDDSENGNMRTLCWKHEDGYNVRLKHRGYGDWEANIYVPDDFGMVCPFEHQLKASFRPRIDDRSMGYIDGRTVEDNRTRIVHVRCSAIEGMPVAELETLVGDFRRYTEDTLGTLRGVDEVLSYAKQYNED